MDFIQGFLEKRLTQKLTMIPNVMDNCWMATSEPRISGGAYTSKLKGMSPSRGSMIVKFPYQFSVVEWNNHTQTTNSQSGHEAATKNVVFVLNASLYDYTYAEDCDSDTHCGSTTRRICKVTVE